MKAVVQLCFRVYNEQWDGPSDWFYAYKKKIVACSIKEGSFVSV